MDLLFYKGKLITVWKITFHQTPAVAKFYITGQIKSFPLSRLKQLRLSEHLPYFPREGMLLEALYKPIPEKCPPVTFW